MERKWKIIIVEDDQKARNILKQMLKLIPFAYEIIGETENIKDAAKIISENEPDILFLDIELADGDGFELLKMLGEIAFEVVFTTAFNQYAIKAFEFSAMDYLLKPIAQNDLERSIQRFLTIKKSAKEQYNNQLSILMDQMQNGNAKRIAIHDARGIEIIELSNILYCKADGNYTEFILRNNNRILSSKNLKEYVKILSDSGFERIHHSYLVNLYAIKKYIKGRGGKVLLENDETLEVSVRKKEALVQKLNRL